MFKEGDKVKVKSLQKILDLTKEKCLDYYINRDSRSIIGLSYDFLKNLNNEKYIIIKNIKLNKIYISSAYYYWLFDYMVEPINKQIEFDF